MPFKDHQPLIFEKHMGLYTNFDSAPLPPGYDFQCTNMCWDIPDTTSIPIAPLNRGSIRTREPFVDQFTLTNIPVKWQLYTKSTGARIIYLDSAGNIRDHTSGLVILGPTLGLTSFHGITINDHFYFTLSDGLKGLANEFVYVYDPALGAAARKAAGRGPDQAIDPPAGAFTVAVSATAGNIEPGLHVISVSYEYNTGFISKPQIWTTFTAPAARKRVDLTNIPTGPAGVVARHIWMSHRVNDYDGNAEKVETFFIYKVNDNVTLNVVGTIDAFDSQLVQSSDPYADLLTDIPAGVYLNIIKGRLVVNGSNANGEVLYISNSFEPEAIDSVDGLKTVSKGDGGTIYTTRVVREFLGVWKGFRTYLVEPNDNDVPRLWQDKQVDGALGAFPQSVGEVLNQSNADKDIVFVVNTSGMFPFTGVYGDNLLANIQATWDTLLSTTRLADLRVAVDPLAKRIYIISPRKADTINDMYMIDYKLGTTKDTVRISWWEIANFPTDMHVVISSVNARGTLLISKNVSTSIANQIVGASITAAELGAGFPTTLSWCIAHPELLNIHVNMIRTDIVSSQGGLSLQYLIELSADGINADDGSSFHDTQPQFMNMIATPGTGNQVDEIPFDFASRVIKIRLATSAVGFQLNKTIIYFNIYSQTGNPAS